MNTKLITILAKKDAKRLVLSPSFLFSQGSKPGWWFILANVVLIGLCLKFFKDYDFEFGNSGNALSEFTTIGIYIFIFILAIYGMLQILYGLARLHVETANALKIYNNSSDVLREVRAKERSRIDLEEIDSLIPDNPDKNLTMLRLSRQVLSDAKDRRFDSPSTIMQPYREESMRYLFKVGVIQKTALQLGITGTFIGLIAAFLGLDMQQVDSSELALAIIPALKYAFITSIAGLISAIILGLFILLFRKAQDRFFQNMEYATQSLVALARNSINKDDFINEFNQLNYALDRAQQCVYEVNGQVTDQTQTISKGLKKLTEVQKEFYGFLGRLSDEERTFLEEIKEYHQNLSPNKISNNLKESMTKSVKIITTTLEENIKKSMSQNTILNVTLDKTNQKISSLNDNINKQNEQINGTNKSIKNVSETFQNSISEISNLQNGFITKITGAHVSTQLSEDMVKASHEVSKSMSGALTELRKDLTGYKQELLIFNKNTNKYFEYRLRLEKLVFKIFAVVIGAGGISFIIKWLFF